MQCNVCFVLLVKKKFGKKKFCFHLQFATVRLFRSSCVINLRNMKRNV